MLLRQRRQLLLRHRARAGHHHARRHVVRAHERRQVVPRDAAHVGLRPQNGAPQPGPVERRLVQQVEQHLLLHARHLLALAQNHATLPLHRARVKLGVQQDVRQHLHRARHVVLEHLGVVHRVLPARVRVQVRAHVLDLHLQLLLRPLVGALERHVLQEVSHAVVLRRLVAAARVDEHAHRRRLAVLGLGGHAQAVGELGDLRGRRVQHVGWVVEGAHRADGHRG
mmetsp:Transcript_11304/g.36101  ORF Transcript_11304/g.36101 Transcript_11304/m.36101 type:complete len:225 (-) Transcript_11304:87-761(-)